MEIVEKSSHTTNWPRANGKTATLLKFAKGGKQLSGFNLDSFREPQKFDRNLGKAAPMARDESAAVSHSSRSHRDSRLEGDKTMMDDGFAVFGSFFDRLEQAAEQIFEEDPHLSRDEGTQHPAATPMPEWIAFMREGPSLIPVAANAVTAIKEHAEDAKPASASTVETQQTGDQSPLAPAFDPVKRPHARQFGDEAATSPARQESSLEQGPQKPVSSDVVDPEKHQPPTQMPKGAKNETKSPSIVEFQATNSTRSDLSSLQATPQWQPPHAQIAAEIAEHVAMLQEPALRTEIMPTLAKSSGNTFRMTLQPGEDLGDLRVTLARRGKQLDVRIVAEKPETHRLLNEDAQRCLIALNELGLDTSQVSVQFGQDVAMSVDQNAAANAGPETSTSKDQHAEHKQRHGRMLEESSRQASTRNPDAVAVDGRTARHDGAIYI